MEKEFHLRVMTADGTALDRQVVSLRIPMKEGSIGSLANHAPMLCRVSKGKLTARSADGEEIVFPLREGVANVRNNTVTILTFGNE